jgi:glycosyltransferase involved in cell wall biosynthesis
MAIFLLIFFLLLTCYFFLIEFYRRSWNQVPEFSVSNPVDEPFISVIIPLRNEETNIPALIESLKHQTYARSRFEIILVDDHSTDRSWEVIKALSADFLNIRPISLSEEGGAEPIRAHKKFAIEKGIEKAMGELIVTTDADCMFDREWLFYIACFYATTNAKFIAAPVKIRSTGSFLSVFQSLDFLTLQGITGASVYKRFHTMCNGANLAYKKAAFYEVNGFSGIDDISSGDDMLLMYKIYKQHPESVFYLKSSNAVVTTNPVYTWRDFFNQRIRWASKATHYDDKKIFWILLLVYSTNLCFLILAIASFWKATWFFFFILLLTAKILVEFPFVNSAAIFFGEKNLMRYFPLMQPIHILYTIAAGWFGKFGTYEWKGRRIKK